MVGGVNKACSRAIVLQWARTLCNDEEGSLEELLPRMQELPAHVLTSPGPDMRPFLVHALAAGEESFALGLIEVWPLADCSEHSCEDLMRSAATHGPIRCLEAIVDKLEHNVPFAKLLYLCASSSRVPRDTVEKVLEKMKACSEGVPDGWFWPTVQAAASHGRVDVLEALLACGLQWDDSGRRMGATMAAAATANAVDFMEALARELREDMMDEREATAALVAAAYQGHAEAMEFLLDLYPESYLGTRPLAYTAVRALRDRGSWGALKVLLQRLPVHLLLLPGSGPRPRSTGVSYLHFAIRELPSHQVAAVVELSPVEAVISARDREGMSLLMLAASRGETEVVLSIVQRVPRSHFAEVNHNGKSAAELTDNAEILAMLQPRVKSAAAP